MCGCCPWQGYHLLFLFSAWVKCDTYCVSVWLGLEGRGLLLTFRWALLNPLQGVNLIYGCTCDKVSQNTSLFTWKLRTKLDQSILRCRLPTESLSLLKSISVSLCLSVCVSLSSHTTFISLSSESSSECPVPLTFIFILRFITLWEEIAENGPLLCIASVDTVKGPWKNTLRPQLPQQSMCAECGWRNLPLHQYWEATSSGSFVYPPPKPWWQCRLAHPRLCNHRNQ